MIQFTGASLFVAMRRLNLEKTVLFRWSDAQIGDRLRSRLFV
jgi:hypothetical protein